MQSAGAYGVVTVLRQNTGTAMELVTFADVVVSIIRLSVTHCFLDSTIQSRKRRPFVFMSICDLFLLFHGRM